MNTQKNKMKNLCINFTILFELYASWRHLYAASWREERGKGPLIP